MRNRARLINITTELKDEYQIPKVELLHSTPLDQTAKAIRTCWQSFDKSDSIEYGVCGEVDKNLIDKIANKFKHGSTLEHQVYKFYWSDISRALLQEIARHRMASPSVKSTRYTLKEIKEEHSFELPYQTLDENNNKIFDIEKARLNASNYLIFTGNDKVDKYSIYALENLRKALKDGISNDRVKYCLPESFKTELTITINARSLQNLLNLRISKSALWEFRLLAKEIFDAIPDDQKFLFEDSIS